MQRHPRQPRELLRWFDLVDLVLPNFSLIPNNDNLVLGEVSRNGTSICVKNHIHHWHISDVISEILESYYETVP